MSRSPSRYLDDQERAEKIQELDQRIEAFRQWRRSATTPSPNVRTTEAGSPRAAEAAAAPPLPPAPPQVPLVVADEAEEEVLASPRPGEDPRRWWRRALLHVLRRAAMAALARAALGVVKALFRARLSPRRLPAALAGELLTLNPLKWAVVLGGWSSTRLVERLLAGVLPPLAATALATALCSLSVLVMNVKTRTEIALYAAVRALHGAAVAHVWPRLPEPLKRFEHWDTVTMGVTAGEILYTMMFAPQCHDPGYQSFLVRCTMIDHRIVLANAGMHRRQIVPEFVDVARERGVAVPASGDAHPKVICELYHPGMGCNENIARWIVRHLTSFSLPLYLPLKLLTMLPKWREVAREPLKSAKRIVRSVISSSLFLTLYCAGPYRSLCLFSTLNIRSPKLLSTLVGILAGLPTLLEPKSRRIDLALYCAMQTLRSSTLIAHQYGYIRRPTRHDVLLLHVLSFVALFVEHRANPQAQHPNVQSFVKWLREDRRHFADEEREQAETKREQAVVAESVVIAIETTEV